MFDKPPENLPIEPKPSTPSPPDVQAGSVPKPLGMQGGIMMPKKSEPEDIFSDMEKTEEPKTPDVEAPPGGAPSGGKMKVAIIVLAVIAIALIIIVAGIFFYRRYIVADSDEVLIPDAMMEDRTAPTTPSVGGIPGDAADGMEDEAPPVVKPTPPPDIPDPTEVEPVERVDADNDGLRDADEAILGTDPRIPDTDGDNLMDGNEVNLGTDPMVADTDGDGLTDGDEVNIWLSNPTLADTDGDGYEDGAEVQNGYNPNGEGRLPGAGE